MNKLLINTCNDTLNIVLEKEDKLISKSISSSAHHNELMLQKIDELLKENKLTIKDICELGVAIGPGSFTGIRVGVSTVKAFRDALNIKAKGVNNLNLLFAMAKKQNPQTEFVAIAGSRDCYFVAREIFGKVYIYSRVLSLSELKTISQDNPIGMYKQDQNLNSFIVKFDAATFADLVKTSCDETLAPVYYQLSQAEKDKFNRLPTEIVEVTGTAEEINCVYAIQCESISTNKITKADIKNMLTDGNHKAYLIKAGGEIAGYLIAEFTDEANIVSVAIKKEFRNLGYASKLIDHLKLEAKNMDLTRLSLEVSTNNPTAFILYDKLGFITRRIRHNYYSDGADCIEMVLNL